jgi:site-specific DNA-methyltransferase (adenine-specific)
MTVEIDLRFGRWQDVLADVECDAWIGDAPYSERTHAGHDMQVRNCKREGLDVMQSDLVYPFLTPDDVHRIVEHWSPRTRGWFVTLTDHVLVPHWTDALRAAGRYVFEPDVPLVELGSRVRLSGDGPSCWTVRLVVARPSTRAFATWGTLPGAYVVTREAKARVGGKPLSAMREIVADYSRPGDLVCDPFAGAATTLIAAAIEGRNAIGSEADREAFEDATNRIRRARRTGAGGTSGVVWCADGHAAPLRDKRGKAGQTSILDVLEP